jgi:tetratricopeptide (TPR) repeat protein
MRLVVSFAVLLLGIAGCGVLSPAGLSAYNEGVQHQQRGERDLAEQQFKLALQQQPELAEARINLGLIYIQDGWYDGAEDQTRKGIEILERTKRTLVQGATYQQTLSLAYSNLGVVQISRAQAALLKLSVADAQRFADLARQSLNKAVELDPSNSRAQATLSQLALFR